MTEHRKPLPAAQLVRKQVRKQHQVLTVASAIPSISPMMIVYK